MHDIEKLDFRTSFKEPITLSGKVLGIKLLSTYDFIILRRRYNRLLKNTFHGCHNKLYRSIAEKASLVSMCLYTGKDKRVFDNTISVLKSLTPYELGFIYKQYVKLENQTRVYENKIQKAFEDVKKHKYQQNS